MWWVSGELHSTTPPPHHPTPSWSASFVYGRPLHQRRRRRRHRHRRHVSACRFTATGGRATASPVATPMAETARRGKKRSQSDQATDAAQHHGYYSSIPGGPRRAKPRPRRAFVGRFPSVVWSPWRGETETAGGPGSRKPISVPLVAAARVGHVRFFVPRAARTQPRLHREKYARPRLGINAFPNARWDSNRKRGKLYV
jgi:hypothetical protein